jgi:hypothetical protein
LTPVDAAEFGEEVGVKYSTWVLKSGQKVVTDEARKFRVGDGEVMPGMALMQSVLPL